MSIFGDVHSLTEGLKVVSELRKSTDKLTKTSQELNENVVKLTATLNDLIEEVKKSRLNRKE